MQTIIYIKYPCNDWEDLECSTSEEFNSIPYILLSDYDKLEKKSEELRQMLSDLHYIFNQEGNEEFIKYYQYKFDKIEEMLTT